MKRRLVATSSLLVIADQALVSGANLALTIFAARYLTAEEFGVFATLWLMLLLVNSFHGATIVMPMMTISSALAKKGGYLSYTKKWQLRFQLVSTGCLLLAWQILAQHINFSKAEYACFIGTILAYHAQDYRRRRLAALELYGHMLWVDAISYGLRVGLLLPALYGSITLVTIFGYLAGTYALGATVAILTELRRAKERPDPESRGHRDKNAARHRELAKNLSPSAILQWLSVNLHVVAATFLLGPTGVAAARLGQSILGVGAIYLQSLENSFPTKLQLMRTSTDSGRRHIRQYMVLRICAFAMLATLMVSFFPSILNFLLDKTYGLSRVDASLIALAQILAFVAIMTRFMLRATDTTVAWLKGYIFAAIVGSAFVVPLQSILGATGIFAGVAISWLLLTMGSIFFARRDHLDRNG